MNSSNSSTFSIATLNLNGETSYSINRRPRLPQSLFDIARIKKYLSRKTRTGLKQLLSSKHYDIIAIQELINTDENKSSINKICKNCGYKLEYPNDLSGSTHCTVAFIIRNSIKYSSTQNIINLKSNKFQTIICTLGNSKFTIVNIHITDHSNEDIILKNYISNGTNNLLLLGDMNSFTENQIQSNKEGSNSDFIKWIHDNFCNTECDSNYTYLSANHWRKLDHIFVSNKCNHLFSSINEIKDDFVNYYYDEKNGFTDHSMLIQELTFLHH